MAKQINIETFPTWSNKSTLNNFGGLGHEEGINPN